MGLGGFGGGRGCGWGEEVEEQILGDGPASSIDAERPKAHEFEAPLRVAIGKPGLVAPRGRRITTNARGFELLDEL